MKYFLANTLQELNTGGASGLETYVREVVSLNPSAGYYTNLCSDWFIVKFYWCLKRPKKIQDGPVFLKKNKDLLSDSPTL